MSAEDDASRMAEQAMALVDLAEKRNLIAPGSSPLVAASDRIVRVDMLTQALAATRSGASLAGGAGGAGWEFARAFGPLVRIAVFEITNSKRPCGWRQLRALLLAYFGEAADALAPAIYLSALVHPDVLPTAAQLADAKRIIEASAPDEPLARGVRAAGLFE